MAVDLSELTEQLLSSLSELVAGNLEARNQLKLHRAIIELAHSIIDSLGISVEDFEKKRREKREKNGGFQKGYVLLEKVLPIGEGALQTKVVKDDKMDAESGAEPVIAEVSSSGIRPIVPKLVRDKIPAIIEKQARKNWEIFCQELVVAEGITLNEAKKHDHPLRGYKAKVRIAGRREIFELLRDKLQEEVTEFRASVETEDRLEDLGDILEVIGAYRFYQQEDS